MKLLYEIPAHLEPHISDCTEEELSRAITTILELAIRHELIYFPDTALERGVKDMKRTLREVKDTLTIHSTDTKKLLGEIYTTLTSLEAKFEVATLNTNTGNNLTIDESNLQTEVVQTGSFEPTEVEIDEMMENLLQDLTGGL